MSTTGWKNNVRPHIQKTCRPPPNIGFRRRIRKITLYKKIIIVDWRGAGTIRF